MNLRLYCLVCCLVGPFLLAQTHPTPQLERENHRATEVKSSSPDKMPCGSASTDLRIIDCEAEQPSTGDNDPEDGAFMRWTATGSTHYYTEIIGNGQVIPVLRSEFPEEEQRSVFLPNQPDGETYEGEVFFGSLERGDCLPEGTYTIRVWSVRDQNNDQRPDRDFSGNIIGCYQDCTRFYRPSCGLSTEQYFTVTRRDVGCNATGGFIDLFAFREYNFYCADTSGLGLTFAWEGPNGFTANTDRIENLEPGPYLVQVSDLNGCTALWQGNVTQLDNVAFDCTAQSGTSFVGATDGAARINVFAGSGDYFVYYTGPVTDTLGVVNGNQINIPDLPAGDYLVTVVDRQSTCEETCAFTIPPPNCETIQVNVLEVIDSDCDGAGAGRIALEFFGGINPQLVWSGPDVNGLTSPVLNNLGAGTYVYTITDDRNCERRGAITLLATPVLNFSCGGISETLPFLDDGALTVVLDGGEAPFVLDYVGIGPTGDTVAIAGGLAVSALDTIPNLPAGTYELTVTDGTGCVRFCTAAVTEPDCDIFPNCQPIDPVSIFGNGSVTLDFDGGPDWFVTVSGPQDTVFQTSVSSNFLEDLPQGNYAVSVYNSAGCLGGCSFAIVAPPCVLTTTPTFNDPSCFGEEDGAIRVNVTGANVGLRIDWDNDSYDGQFQLTDLPPGTYRYRVSDSTECPLDTVVITLDEPAPLTLSLEQVDSISCFGDATATLRALATGGTAPLNYQWSVAGASADPLLPNLTAGNYTLAVSDANGCTVNASIAVSQPPPLTLACRATAETVAGIMDGTISFTTTGAGEQVQLTGDLGTRSVSANIDTTFTGLSPGTYQLTLTDENGCSTSCTAIVNAGPCQIGVVLSSDQPDCDNPNGSATASPTNPLGNVVFAWSNGATTATVTDLPPGNHVVTVTDDSGCEATGSVSILPFTDIPELVNAAVSPVCPEGCADLQLNLAGSAPFTVSYRYRAADGSEQLRSVTRPAAGSEVICPTDFNQTTLVGGNLDLLEVTDANGCSRPLDQQFTIVAFPAATAILQPVLCRTDELNYVGETFDFNRPTGTVVLPGGASSGCDSIVNVALQFYPLATGTFDTTICDGDQLTFLGETFNENRPSGTVVLPNASVNGCDSLIAVSLTFYPPAIGAVDTMLCPGSTFTYFGQTFTDARRQGTVVLPGAGRHGCDSLVDVRIDFRPVAEATLDTTLCPFDVIDYFGTFFSEFNTAGRVRIPGASVNGCDSFVNVSVTVLPETFGQIDTTVCAGEPVFIGNNVFLNEAVNVPTATGIPNRFGCDSIALVTVRYRREPLVSLVGDGIRCPGEPVRLTIRYDGEEPVAVALSSDPANPIVVTTGANEVVVPAMTGEEVTILSVTGPAACGYRTRGLVPITEVATEVSIRVLTGDDTYVVNCNGDRNGAIIAELEGNDGPYTYRWNTGGRGAVLTGLGPGAYTVTATSSHGCETRARISLQEPPPLVVQTRRLDPNCLDSIPKVVLREVSGGAGPYLFRVDQSAFATAASPDTLVLPYGTSRVEVEDMNGCRFAEDFTFRPLPLPTERVMISPAQAIIEQGDSVELVISTALTEPVLRLSGPNDSLELTTDRIFVAPRNNAIYKVTAEDAFGCSATAFAKILIDDFVPVFAPNVFSPNGDRTNEKFRLFSRSSTVLAYHDFAIYSRWGEMVYAEENPIAGDEEDWGWNGVADTGKPYGQAVYVYRVRVELADGRTFDLTGDVLLMR